MSYTYVPAKHTGGKRPHPPTTIIIHTAETPETPTSAEGVANYFRSGSGGRKASAHYCIDSDSVVQCVKDDVIAYAAPPLNEEGLHLEMSGRASQTAAEWQDPFSTATILRTASLAADLCITHEIWPAPKTAAALEADVRGLTTHAAVSSAFHKSDHTDPGTGFPWNDFVRLVQTIYADRINGPASQPPPPTPHPGPGVVQPPAPAPIVLPTNRPTLRDGSRGRDVLLLQLMLAKAFGPFPTADGLYGPITAEKIRGIQRLSGLPQTGVADTATWKAIDYLYLGITKEYPPL